ncbi:MAG: hypothetical protein LBM93_06885, partial [Oscillospiraceae bacterium]|nr:hypothetical protein [Oscillospiraceae bacterium]
TTENDPFAVSEEEESSVFASWGADMDWEEGKYYEFNYAPEITFTRLVHSYGKRGNFGLVMYINGILQPCKLDNSEEKLLHIYELDNEEKKQTISFSPVVGEKGDKLYVEICKIYDPNFVPSSPYPHYKFSHEFNNMTVTVDVTETTGKTYPPICTNYVKEPVTEEIRNGFQNEWKPENDLDRMDFVKTLKNGNFYTTEDYANGQADQTPFEVTDSVEIALYGGGEPCMYRVSMYINHQLVKGAFDGMDYIDMEMSKNYISRKQVDYKNSGIKLNEYNFIYFVAVPLYGEYAPTEKRLWNSDSVTLMGY